MIDAPVASPTSNSVLAANGQTFAATSLFTASDADGDSLIQYDFWDTGSGGGRWVINGTPGATKVQQPTFNGDSSGGTLNVTDGTHSANIVLIGNYLASTFVPTSDGHGGTAVIDPAVLGGVQPLVTPPHA